MFEIGDLIHEDFDGFLVTRWVDDDFVEGAGKSRVFSGDFEEFLVVHDENHADVAGLDNGGKEIRDIDRTRAFFEKELGVFKTEDDVFGRVDFIENVDENVFELAGVISGRNKASDVKRVDLAEFEITRDFSVGVKEGLSEVIDDSGAAGAVGANKGDVLAATVRKGTDNLINDFVVFGLLDVVIVAVITIGKIGGEALQSGGVAESKVAADATGMDGFFAIFDEAMEVIVPSDALA